MIIAWVNKCLSRLLSTVLIAYILITLLMQMEPTEVRWIPLRDMVHFFLSLVLEVCIVTCWITLSFDWVDSPRLPFGPSEAPCLRDGERSLLWQEKGKEGGSCSNRHEQFQFLHYLKTKKKLNTCCLSSSFVVREVISKKRWSIYSAWYIQRENTTWSWEEPFFLFDVDIVL